MKRLYWRPPRISRAELALIALVAVTAVALVESFPVERRQPWFDEKLHAAELAQQGFDVIKAEKARRGILPDPELDPRNTGLIGVALSPVTSNTGYLSAKQASINPNFAAVVVHWLRQANVQSGDLVAVGASGSFPALNIATFAAIQTLGAQPIVIASTSASQFGANNVGLLWIDMERVLEDHHVFRFRSVAASRGGIDDRGFGMSEEGRSMLDRAVLDNGLELIESASLGDAIEKRMAIYNRRAAGRPIRAYVNIGGGSASVGTHIGKKLFDPGLNRSPPRGSDQVDSVMLRFAQRGIPVIHITRIAGLASQYGLEQTSLHAPRVGEGDVFVRTEYNPWLALAGLAVTWLILVAFVRLDIGQRILRSVRSETAQPPQHMV